MAATSCWRDAWCWREALLVDGRVGEARGLVESVIAEDPAHLDLPPVRARLGRGPVAPASAAGARARARAPRRRPPPRARGVALPGLAASRSGNWPRRREALARLARNSAAPGATTRPPISSFEQRRGIAGASARVAVPVRPAIAAAEQGLQQSRQARQDCAVRPTRRELRAPARPAWGGRTGDRARRLHHAARRQRLGQVARRGSDFTGLAGGGEGRARPRGSESALLRAGIEPGPAPARPGLPRSQRGGRPGRRPRTRRARAWPNAGSPTPRNASAPATGAKPRRRVVQARHWQPPHPGIANASARLRVARGRDQQR